MVWKCESVSEDSLELSDNIARNMIGISEIKLPFSELSSLDQAIKG
jgi:hypothetical protein